MMTQLNELRIMNDTMIIYLKKLGIDCQRNNIVKNILEDDTCFYKMSKEDAILILKEIGVQSNIENIYAELTSSDLFYELYRNGKIDVNDNELIIKYKIYDYENLFKNNSKTQNEIVNESTALVKIDEKSIFKKIIEKIKNIFKR